MTTQVRLFIAGAILRNQQLAERAGLGMSDMQCINVLEMLGTATPGKLAALTGLTTGGVTVMLDRLETAGYVKREPNPEDRRSVLVRVSPKKVEKLHSLYASIGQQFNAFLESCPEAELQAVAAFLVKANNPRGPGKRP